METEANPSERVAPADRGTPPPAGETKPSTPAQRRAAVIELAASHYRVWYDAHGQWVSPLPGPDTRETLWGMFCLLAGGKEDVALANAVLRALVFHHHHPTRTPEEQESPFDIFVTNHTVQTLAQHGDKLDADVRRKLERWARHALEDFPGDRQCDYQFHGANDNMPSKATMGMILGGEYFGHAETVEHGLWNLRQLRDLLTRRGLLSEYTSPTYSPLSIINLTEIALHARHPEARELAAQCAERVWAEVLGHFHPPTGVMGGPYSRAYQLDSTGHMSTMACLLYIALGDTAVDLIAELSGPTIRLVHHHDSHASQLGLVSWVASCPAEPPAFLREWMQKRAYPFRFRASAERGGDQSCEVNTSFYAEEDFAIGTADGDDWSVLQSEMYFLQFRRRAPSGGVEDLRTAYCRYLINDQRPGDRKADHLLKPHGIVHTVHHDRLALVLTRPALSLADTEVRALKFSVVLPEHFGAVERAEVRDGSIFVQDGPVFLGLRPLNVTDWGRGEASRIEPLPNYRLASFYNYDGEAKVFTREELGRTLNGLVAVVGLRAEEDWETFVARVQAMEVLDYYHFNCRTVRCKLGGTVLGMSYAVPGDRVRFRTVNGELAPRPVWQADGMTPAQLPFLTHPQPNSLELPFRHLKAIWAPNDQWVIGSKGRPRPQDGQPPL